MKSILLILALSATGQLSAQGALKNVGNAAKNKLESQDFNSSRSNKEKTQLRNERPKEAPGSAAPSPEADSSIAGTSTTANGRYPSSYTFDKTVTYSLTDLKKTDKPADEIVYFYADGSLMTKMSKETNLTVITDFVNEVSITFDDKNMNATVMSNRWMTDLAGKFASESEVTVTKTGNTKDILGRSCEEYVITDKKSKTECWITTEIPMDYRRTVEALTKSKVSYVKGDVFPAKALMMEMRSFDRKGEAESHMIATAYTETPVTRSLSAYEVTSLVPKE
jgi:hypothetical protein